MPPTDAPSMLQRWVIDGGFMMIFLVPAALLAITFTVQGILNLRRNRVAPAGFAGQLSQALETGGMEAARRLLASAPHSLGVILANVLNHLDIEREADPAEILREEIQTECDLISEQNAQLGLIYHVAPLMGLLGTVFGMLNTFSKFAQSTNPSVQDLAEGINIAFVTTAWGLAIAIPSYTVLFLIRRRITAYETLDLPHAGSAALRALLEHPPEERPSP